MLRHLLYIARKDLRFTIRRRETWLWLFIMPIVFFYFIGTITGGGMGGIAERANLALWAEEPGPLGAQLQKRLDDQGFDVTQVDSLHLFEAAKRRLALPAHFSDSLRAGRPVELVLGDDYEGLYNDYRGLQIKRAVYGLLADLLVTESGDSAALAALNARPRALSIAVTSAGARLEPPSGFAQSVPGIMVMFTVLVLGTSGAIFLVEERRLGLLRRLAYAPVPRVGIVLGKWSSKLALGIVQIAFAMLAGTLIFGMDWGANLPMVLLLLLSYAGVIAGLGMLLGSISKSAGQAAAIGVVAANLLGALGGCWWPIEITPPFMRKLALFLPTGWAMDGLHKLVSFGAAPSSVLPHVLGMGFLTLLLVSLTARVFRFE